MNSASIGKLIVEELELRIHVGDTPEERAFSQRVTMNLEVDLDVRRAAQSGKLKDTVCYLKLVKLLEEYTSSRKWVLVEQLAEDVAQLVFETFSAAKGIRIQIHKFVVPIVKWVGLEIYRRRKTEPDVLCLD